jgi:hypothetical protein
MIKQTLFVRRLSDKKDNKINRRENTSITVLDLSSLVATARPISNIHVLTRSNRLLP